MATVDELVVGLSAKDSGLTVALGNIISLLDRIATSSESTNSTLNKMVGTAGDSAKNTVKSIGSTVDASKKIEDAGKKTVDVFGKLKTTLISFVSATALFSLGKKLVTDVVKTDMALGSLARTTGRSVQEVQGLQRAFKECGKSEDSLNRSIQEHARAKGDYQTNHTLSHKWQSAANIVGVGDKAFVDENKNFRKIEDTAQMIVEGALKHYKGDKAKTYTNLIANGFDADWADVYLHWGRNVVDKNIKTATANEASVAQSEKLNEQYQIMCQRIEDLERALASKLMPYLEAVLEWLIKFADELMKDPDKLTDFIVVLGLLALAFGAVFNPIGTVIGAGLALIAVLYKLTDGFAFVKKGWNALMLAFKTGWNGTLEAIAKFCRILGFEDFASSLESMKADTSEEEKAIGAGSGSGGGGVGGWGDDKSSSGSSGYEQRYSSGGNGGYNSYGSYGNSGGAVGGGGFIAGSTNIENNDTNFQKWTKAVVARESAGKDRYSDGTTIRNHNSNGSYDWGLYQINDINVPLAAKLIGLGYVPTFQQKLHNPDLMNKLGYAFLKHAYDTSYKKFGGDAKKMFAYYHSPKAINDAIRFGGANWEEWLRTHYPNVYTSANRKYATFMNGGGGDFASGNAYGTGNVSYPNNVSAKKPKDKPKKPRPIANTNPVTQQGYDGFAVNPDDYEEGTVDASGLVDYMGGAATAMNSFTISYSQETDVYYNETPRPNVTQTASASNRQKSSSSKRLPYDTRVMV